MHGQGSNTHGSNADRQDVHKAVMAYLACKKFPSQRNKKGDEPVKRNKLEISFGLLKNETSDRSIASVHSVGEDRSINNKTYMQIKRYNIKIICAIPFFLSLLQTFLYRQVRHTSDTK